MTLQSLPGGVYRLVLNLDWLAPASHMSNSSELLNAHAGREAVKPSRIALEDVMRAFRFLNLAILLMLVASSTALYAQDDKPQEDNSTRQVEPKPQPKQEAKPQDEAKPLHQDEAKPSKQDQQEDKQKQKQAHAQPAGKSAHIPDDKFQAHFGRSHTFTAKKVIVAGRPQFQYSGYSFALVDAWPGDWAYTDNCYIDYVDGDYFLFDLLHPGVRIAVFVVM